MKKFLVDLKYKDDIYTPQVFIKKENWH